MVERNSFKIMRKYVRKGCCWIWQITSSVYLAFLKFFRMEPLPQPDEVVSTGKDIYLTFDDGPGPYTKNLLKTLARYNVKATFFVTGKNDTAIITDIASAGHTIGNHTVSHQYSSIYASEEAFFDELHRMDAIIMEKIGISTRLMRFPGGSSNTCSRFNPKIMTRLTSLVEKEGYLYLDWNVDSGDAGNAKTPGEVYKNVISGIKDTNVAIVLQHDNRAHSVITVQRIIVWGLKHGYTFLPVNENAPSVHHHINN